MNILDRAIAVVSPGVALRRAQARAGIAMMARSYDGASVGRRTDDWIARGGSANAEVGPALPRLRDRSRDLTRNNPYACKAVSALTSNIVGTGIMPRARAADAALAEQADKLWLRFAEACDADGLTDFAGLQSLIVRTMVESGECLVRIRERRPEDGLPVPLQLQVLEPDYLDASKSGDTADGGYIIHGVEFDPLGRRRAYWLYPAHPGEVATYRGMSQTSRSVSAGSVLHVFDRQRPGQARGAPWFAPAVMRLRDLDEYDEAELVRKRIEACFATFVTGEAGQTLSKPTTDASGRRVETLRPGTITYLEPGSDVTFGSPQSATGYAEYMRVQLHAIAAGVGLTYELLTGDLSQVNYSSIRAGLIEFRRRIEALQWQVLVPTLCRPVWQRFVVSAQMAGQLAGGIIDAEWTAPRFEAVDPGKDVEADIAAVRGGLMTLPEAIARQGYDPARVLAEIAATNAQLDALGIVLDTDPRRSTRTGAEKQDEMEPT